MNRFRVDDHASGRAVFVDITPARTVQFSVGERTYGQFQKIDVSTEDAIELAEWILAETKKGGAT